jgi:thioredoxin-related protein
MIAVCSLGGYRLWQFKADTTSLPLPSAINSTPAIPTSIAGKVSFDLNSKKKWVVLVLSTQCHFCQESAPFHERLAQMLQNSPDTGLIAVFPQDRQTVEQYKATYKVNFPNIITDASLNKLQVRGTPTLLLVDQHGKVLKSWRGRLPENDEKEVRTELGLKN